MRRATVGIKTAPGRATSPNLVNTFQLERIELREIGMPLKSAFETSFGVTTERRVLIVSVHDKSGAVGWGECTAMEQPLFNPESIDTAWAVMVNAIAPMLAAAKPSNALEVGRALEPIRGNRMAIGAVEVACWDLEAKLNDQPLWKYLGGTFEEINCGVSIGLQNSVDVLLEKVTREVESGYQRIKLKIKPGHDVELVKAVRNRYPDIQLSVDANSAYRLNEDLGVMQALDEFGLLMIEQPLEAGDLIDHAKLQAKLKTRLCLDESITSLRDARQAIELDACRIINIKLGRVGGHVAAKAIQEMAKANNIPVWCGGMLESGIGRAHNIAMSTLAGFTLPGDVSASARYWESDIVEPPITVSANGTITPPATPGIGFAVREDRIKELSVRTETLRLASAAEVSAV